MMHGWKVWTAVLGASAGCHDIVVETDITYDERFASTRMDMYAPAGSSDTRPAVIVLHGGAWSSRYDFLERDGTEDHARRLAAAGFVTFNVDYRLTGRSGDEDGVFPHAVQDVLCALAYVRLHADEYGIDPERIASYGYSAGGHLASMLGVATRAPAVTPDCAAAEGDIEPVRAVVSGAGPQLMSGLSTAGDFVSDFIGGSCDDLPEVCADASPISYVNPGAPPYLFIHGEDDWFVDFSQSVDMRDALSDVATDSRILKIPGGGHVWNHTASGDEWDLVLAVDSPAAFAATIDFLDHTIGAP